MIDENNIISSSENIFRKKRNNGRRITYQEPTQPIQQKLNVLSYEDYRQQHEQPLQKRYKEAHEEVNEEMFRMAQMQMSNEQRNVDAQDIRSKNRTTLSDLRDVANNPSPRGLYQMHINGRIMDLATLEEYIIVTNFSNTLSKIKRYNAGVMYDDFKGYERILHSAKKHRRKR